MQFSCTFFKKISLKSAKESFASVSGPLRTTLNFVRNNNSMLQFKVAQTAVLDYLISKMSAGKLTQ